MVPSVNVIKEHPEESNVSKNSTHAFLGITCVITGSIEKSENVKNKPSVTNQARSYLAVIQVAKQIDAHFGLINAIGIN